MIKKLSLFLILTCAVLPLWGELFFSEYLEGSSYNKALEIYNPGPGARDLEGYGVEIYFNGNTTPAFRLALSGNIEEGDVFVIAATNVNSPDFPLSQVDLFYGTSWFNGDDTVILKKDQEVIDSIGQLGYDPGSAFGTSPATTRDATLRRKASIVQGDINPMNAFDPALEWDGFPQDDFAGLGNHGLSVPTTIPGPTPELTPTPVPTSVPTPTATTPVVLVPVYEIQGLSHHSPYQGQTVTTRGVVTAVLSGGFFLQDPAGDGDDRTSDGIYVYTSSAPRVISGDLVTVTGQISEYIPGGSSSGNLSTTEFNRPAVQVISSGNPLPEPVLLGGSGRILPTEVIDNDLLSVYDPEEDGIDLFESLEGMLVEINAPKAISPRNHYNEIFVVADQGAGATGLTARGGIITSAGDFNPERIQIQLDDTLLPGFSPEVNTGDYLDNVTGPLGYNYGNFELYAMNTFSVYSAGLIRETGALSPGSLSVVSYNVENLDPNDEDGDKDVAEGKFIAIARQIVENLNTPDILSLQEIQDNDGSSNTGNTDASLTYETLITEVINAGGPAYLWADLPPVNNQDGGEPGGNIRVGFLYNPARVQLIPGSLTRIEDEDLTDGDTFKASRKSLMGEFSFEGNRFFIINNHFASKGGGTPLYGEVQPPVNGKLEQREAQAAAVAGVVEELLAEGKEVIVMGDLNEYWFESSLAILKGAGLTNMAETLPPVERYSYNYEGNSQTLDHILLSPGLTDLASFDYVHINSEFANQATDHDPLLLELTFAAPGTADIRVMKGSRKFDKFNYIYWITRDEENVAGYDLYAAEEGASLVKLNDDPITVHCTFDNGSLYYSFSEGKMPPMNNTYYQLYLVDTAGRRVLVRELYISGTPQ